MDKFKIQKNAVTGKYRIVQLASKFVEDLGHSIFRYEPIWGLDSISSELEARRELQKLIEAREREKRIREAWHDIRYWREA